MHIVLSCLNIFCFLSMQMMNYLICLIHNQPNMFFQLIWCRILQREMSSIVVLCYRSSKKDVWSCEAYIYHNDPKVNFNPESFILFSYSSQIFNCLIIVIHLGGFFIFYFISHQRKSFKMAVPIESFSKLIWCNAWIILR